MIYNNQIREEARFKLNSDDGPIKCPICGHENVHVSVERLTPEATGTRQGGYAVVLWGECGHQWGEVYAEHKGVTVKVPILFQAAPAVPDVQTVIKQLDSVECGEATANE